jgi:hypothetical protein
MSTHNSHWTRTRWSLGAGAWLAALLLLSLSSGGGVALASSAIASSALAATTSSQSRDAVLWLLHEMQSTAPSSSLTSSTVSRAEAESLWRELHDAPLVVTTEIAGYENQSAATGSQANRSTSSLLSAASFAVVPPVPVLRFDATKTLCEYSLSAHEAAFLAGTRTNSYLE